METISVLISAEEIDKKLTALAEQISMDYAGKDVTFICVLKGGVMFMVDLAKKINLNVSFDFMDVSSYGNSSTSSGQIKINKDLEHSIEGKDVLLIEDIIDTGRTLSYLIDYLKSKKPNSLRICTLLDKPDRRVVSGITADYTGFVIPDKFVVGFGLDYAQKYRNLDYIGVIDFGEEKD